MWEHILTKMKKSGVLTPEMEIRMRKNSGNFMQFHSIPVVNESHIPPLNDAEQFKHLGRLFDFGMKNEVIKAELDKRLTSLLETTSDLNIKPQQKLKRVKIYIPSRITFELRVYDISYTWINRC